MSHANTSHQPTAPTITVTRSSLSPTPSRFLDLPLEIQRNILEKVYEGSYVLKAQNAVLNGVSWLGGPPLAPLRTCWHVYREGLPFYRKACYHLDVSDVHVSRIDTTVSTKGRSWISSVFREVTMHYSGTYVPSSLVELLLRPYTNLQTIRLITTDCSITSSRQVKDACQHAEDVLNRPCVISIAEWCVKTFTESSVPPSFRNLVKQITFIEYVGAVEDWAHHWAEFKVCFAFRVTCREDTVKYTHANSWKEPTAVPPDELLRRNHRAVVNQVANLRGPPDWRDLSYPPIYQDPRSKEQYYFGEHAHP